MAIILEGFDNSGKSTLAASFGLDVVHPGPRPRSFREENDYLESQLRDCRLPIVMDRVTSVSTPCYTGDLHNPRYRNHIKEMLDTKHCVLIYCRPPIEVIKDFSKHVAKSYDENRRLDWLQDNAEKIVGNYDRYLKNLPHLVYDYTNPKMSVVQIAYDALFTIGAWKSARSHIR